MNPYAGTQTEKNLEAAFAGESQARNKYTYFASVAKKEGYEQISALFLKTADNEKEHAKMWLKELSGIGDTKANLAAAADGENFEWTDMYENFARIFRERGTILISHRLASARMADKILVLDGGRVVQTGSHEELMAQQGLYRTMYLVQSSFYQEGKDAPGEGESVPGEMANGLEAGAERGRK